MHEWLPLVGIPIMVAGFALRLNALLTVVIAGAVTAASSGLGADDLLVLFGEKFLASRQLAAFVLILPVIGLLERFGLRERAQWLVGRLRAATSTRILMAYFLLRELSGALGLPQIAGQVQTVRPLLAPMVEGAAELRHGDLPPAVRDLLRAHAAACDNIAIFFSEDIFIAFGAVLLIDRFLKDAGIGDVAPLHIGLWGIPTAIGALLIHFARLAWLERQIVRQLAAHRPSQAAT